MRYQGKITGWNDEQGFGFVVPNGGGQQAFVHIKAFTRGQKRPVGNEVITYELAYDGMGRPQAEKITFALKRVTETRPTAMTGAFFALALLFLLGMGVAVLAGRLPTLLFTLYGALSLGTFVLYAIDKSAAAKGEWRTKEQSLHLMALLGGWPGAAAAQSLLRHKSSKPEFQVVYRATVVLNCVALAGLLMWPGTQNFILSL